MHVVFHNADHAGKWDISGSLTQAVDSSVNAGYASINSRKYIGGGKVVIVVRVKVKFFVRESLYHLATKVESFQVVENPKCVGEHEAFDRLVLQGFDQLENILR